MMLNGSVMNLSFASTLNQKYDMTDAQLRILIHNLALKYRREAAESLLIGNDTGCFTTEQYRIRFIELENKRFNLSRQLTLGAYDKIFGPNWTWDWLESIPETVREVSPDIWAATNQLEDE